MDKKKSDKAASRIFREIIAKLDSVPWDENEDDYTPEISNIIQEEAEK